MSIEMAVLVLALVTGFGGIISYIFYLSNKEVSLLKFSKILSIAFGIIISLVITTLIGGAPTQALALIAGAAAFVTYIAYIVGKDKFYFKVASVLLIVQAVLVTAAVIILLVALVKGDFRYHYVASYTDSSLPFAYKLSALWAGQAGSLLFWTWLAVIFSAIELWRTRGQSSVYRSFIFIVTTFTSTYFLFLCTAVTPTFEMMAFIQPDGRGMNPMLQNPGMMIHPPLLYIGFVGFMIPFAHAFASSCTHDVTSYWIKATRGWTLLTWVFLTSGIVLGAWWAYVELGWGGYWAWDPVENASLFPWITATAMLHAAITYERKGRLKAWTYALILITYQLTIFGTYLTRSGVMTDSVHSFGSSPLGVYFPIYILLTTVVFLISIYRNRKTLSDNEDFNFASKEGVFFVAMLCFVAITTALILYTMLPVITQNLLNNKISINNSGYNVVSIPFFIVIFLLASFGPIIPYGKAVFAKFMRSYAPSLIGALIITTITAMMGYTGVASILLTFTATASAISFLILAYRAIKGGGVSALIKQRRIFGAIIVHLGLVMMAFGIIYSAFYKEEVERVVAPGEQIEFKDYNITVGNIEHEDGPNYHADYVSLDFMKNGRYVTSLFPEIRLYNNYESNYFAEVAYYSMAKGDIYTILHGYDNTANQIRITIVFEPLIIWIWVGCIIMCLGALYGATQNSLPRVSKEA